jgi:hypothetical protein
MRSATMAVVAALGLITMTNAGSAAPVVPSLGVGQDTAIVQVPVAAVEDGTRIGGDGACRTDTDTTALTHTLITATGTNRGIGRPLAITAQRTN